MLATNVFSFSYNIFCPIKDKSKKLGKIRVVYKCFQFDKIRSFDKDLEIVQMIKASYERAENMAEKG